MRTAGARGILLGFLLLLDVLLLIGGMKDVIESGKATTDTALRQLSQFNPILIAEALGASERSCWAIYRHQAAASAACTDSDRLDQINIPVCNSRLRVECKTYYPEDWLGWIYKQVSVFFFALNSVWGSGWLFIIVCVIGFLTVIAADFSTDAIGAAIVFSPIVGSVIMVLVIWFTELLTWILGSFLSFLLLINSLGFLLAWPLFLREWWKRGNGNCSPP
jgi:hypothetical protein